MLLRILPLWTLLLVACSSPPQRDYLDQAQQEIGQVPDWPAREEGAREAIYLNRLIGSAQLDGLLARALAANPGLQQTLITLRMRRAEQRRSSAARRPTLEAGVSAASARGEGESYGGSLAVGWELDLWRKLADEETAAARDVDQQRTLYRTARDTLAAEVMKSWLKLIAGRHAIDIERRRLANLEQNERLILLRYRNGLGTLEDLDSARSSAAGSRATLEQYREALAQSRRALQTLLGRADLPPPETSADYPDVVLPLADLPAQTLQRRPDLRAAYQAIAAADLRTSVAYKELLPSLSLSAALDTLTDTPGRLLADPVWSLLARLTAPLYKSGELRAAAEIAGLETALAFQGYRETLLGAVTEVGDALGLEGSLARRLAHTEAALASARNNLAQYRHRYRSGLVTILDLINVQQQTYDLEARRDDLIHQRLANRVDLGLALGLGVEPALETGVTE